MAIGTSPNYNIDYAWMSLIRTRIHVDEVHILMMAMKVQVRISLMAAHIQIWLDEWTSYHDGDT